jgi:hypothetical protein
VTVSNEDREAAIDMLTDLVRGAGYEKPSSCASRTVVDALIAHGWGPRPTVSQAALIDHAKTLVPKSIQMIAGDPYVDAVRGASELRQFLTSLGIEVTDD